MQRIDWRTVLRPAPSSRWRRRRYRWLRCRLCRGGRCGCRRRCNIGRRGRWSTGARSSRSRGRLWLCWRRSLRNFVNAAGGQRGPRSPVHARQYSVAGPRARQHNAEKKKPRLSLAGSFAQDRGCGGTGLGAELWLNVTPPNPSRRE
jgi:hypothetical protein